MINEQLKVLQLPSITTLEKLPRDIKDVRNEAVRQLMSNQALIQSTFNNDEYIKMDLTRGEIIGLKSTSKMGNMPIGDLPALDFVIRNDDLYKNSEIINLGNINMLYAELS